MATVETGGGAAGCIEDTRNSLLPASAAKEWCPSRRARRGDKPARSKPRGADLTLRAKGFVVDPDWPETVPAKIEKQAFLLTGDAAATDPVCSLAPQHSVVVSELKRVDLPEFFRHSTASLDASTPVFRVNPHGNS